MKVEAVVDEEGLSDVDRVSLDGHLHRLESISPFNFVPPRLWH